MRANLHENKLRTHFNETQKDRQTVILYKWAINRADLGTTMEKYDGK